MIYLKALIYDKRKEHWIRKSKKLFMKYDRLSLFTYEGTFDMDFDFMGDDYITVSGNHNPNNENGNDPKTYYVAETKEEYAELKHALLLELSIRYPLYA